MAPAVLLIGTLDTKAEEYAYLRDRLREAGVDVLLADVGTLEEPGVEPDITRDEVAAGVGADPGSPGGRRRPRGGGDRDGRCRRGPRAAPPRGGADRGDPRRRWLRRHRDRHQRRCRRCRSGVPKLMVSTMAAGDTRDYIGSRDVTLMHPRRRTSPVSTRSRRRVLANAAAAMAGMVSAAHPVEVSEERPLIGADDVRGHHALRDRGPSGAGVARVRAARLPRHGGRRAGDGGA